MDTAIRKRKLKPRARFINNTWLIHNGSGKGPDATITATAPVFADAIDGYRHALQIRAQYGFRITPIRVVRS